MKENKKLKIKDDLEKFISKLNKKSLKIPLNSPNQNETANLDYNLITETAKIDVSTEKIESQENINHTKSFDHLKEIEKRYNLISENTGDVIWTLDWETQIFTYVSPSVEKLRGYTPDEVKKQTLQDTLSKEAYQYITENMPLRLKGFYSGDDTMRIMTHEVDQPCKDGSFIPTEVVTTLIPDETGKVVEILGITRNISERKKAEQKLIKSEKTFRSFIEKAPLPIFVVSNYDHKILNLNKKFIEVFGYELEDIPNFYDWLEFFSEKNEFKKRIGKARNKNFNDLSKIHFEFAPFETWIKCKSGSKKYVESRIVSFEDFHIVFYNDLTERIISQQSLRNSEINLERAQRLAKLGNWTFNPKTMECVWSKNTFEIFGKSVLETPTYELFMESVHPEDKENLNNFISEQIHSRSSQFETECRIFRNGEVIFLKVLSEIARNNKGEASLLFGTIQDISDIKQYQIELEKLNQKIAESEESFKNLNAQKDKLFSIIAHDLKNPFHILLSFSSLLLDENSDLDYEEIKQSISAIFEASKRGNELLENLLSWARFQSNRIEFLPELVNLNKVLTNAISSVKMIADKKNISIEMICDHEFFVEVDKQMLQTVIRNLLTNAIKFSLQNAIIKIEAEKLSKEFLISVKDNGIGIPSEDIDKLFRSDVKYSRSGTLDESGTGLGLVLCKEFIEKHGGKIWVQSEINNGSDFYFTLPKK